MTEQPTALRLADALERCLPHDSYELHAQREAADELRRLHGEVEELSAENMMHQNRIHDLENWVDTLRAENARLKTARQSI